MVATSVIVRAGSLALLSQRRNVIKAEGAMPGSGQKRRFDRRLVTSGLPGSTDIRKVRRHVSKVPKADITARAK